MRKDDFTVNAPGRLVEAVARDGPFWAYVPQPLPPQIVYASLVSDLSRADHALGELNGAGRMLPNPHMLIGPLVRREAIESSRIEGTIVDLRQLALFEVDPDLDTDDRDEFADRQEVSNYVGALEYGLARLRELPVSKRLMKEVHAKLMNGVRGQEKRPGEFRDRQNAIGRHDGVSAAEARFVPPPAREMEVAMDELEKYINQRGPGLPTLIDLAVIHYQFETIHPFWDGNGRLGRLLTSLLLQERGLLSEPLLYLSAYFERNRDSYTDLMLQVSRAGAWEDWIRFFLRAVAHQAKEASGRCRAILELREAYRDRLSRTGTTANALRLVDLIFGRMAITTSSAAAALDISFKATQRGVEALAREGILTEATGKQRDRVYFALEIMKIVHADADDPSPSLEG